ncbi:MAG TPA: YndJ family transporter [Iamia sp.]|nr:YndJ family transporter [Iamia sp.]
MSGYLTLIDLVVVAGAAVVLPVALGRWAGAWLVVAASTAMALSVDPGPAGLAWSLPWAVVAAAATVSAGIPVLRRSIPAGWGPLRPPTLDGVASVAAPAFALVAGTGLVESCGDLGAFGFGEPITRLAAVHFTFAGAATTALGRAARRAAAAGSRRRQQAATAGLVLALVAPPVVGLGFFTSAALPQVGGAVLMAAAAYLIAGCHLAEAWVARRTRVGRLLAVSGLSVWVPMALAVGWALAQHTGGPALSIPDMARIHGSLNAFGFVGCGLAARWLVAHPAVVQAETVTTAGAPEAVPA